jgi:hypothetical protein
VEHRDDDAAATEAFRPRWDDDDCEHGTAMTMTKGTMKTEVTVRRLRACFSTSALIDSSGTRCGGPRRGDDRRNLNTGEATIGPVKAVPPHKGDDHKKSRRCGEAESAQSWPTSRSR